MTTRMLIDATHAEETRVVVVKGNRLEEFDFETATKKQLKGNIYLAKVTRVEPSLQAAFVDYGGNRHGFLAFNEIHPDYYQIPVADREALLQEEAEQAAQDAALDDAESESESEGESGTAEQPDGDGDTEDAAAEASASEDDETDEDGDDGAIAVAESVTTNGDAMDEVPRPRTRSRRSYKIQEVIKKRQILLVQVVKEERGNKGAALTTYLSLAGRYCVLMPNTARGGGISRKIANQTARRKLKTIVSELEVPEGMGVIVRTAGQSRTKSEIKRDFEYLLRMWDSVRELTLQSTAPTVVYEEASLIKRAVRDLYTKDVDEILVEGEDGYRMAKDFMRMLLPSHAKKVQPYRDRIPSFHRYQVEQQLDTMHSNVVHLKSGGYLVLSPTEALVAVDVNSGRSTKERNIEETALKTNLEAAEEVARQLRLRDLAGLIVIDFIDMEENRHNRAVERRIKDCLKDDRARIQVGRISSFGLLEMSRQRLRPSLFEASMVPCPHCAGTGHVRSTESTALHVLRGVEDEGIRKRASEITLHVPADVAPYLLNQKRDAVAEIEARYNMRVFVFVDPELIAPDYRLDITRPYEGEDGDAAESAPAAQPEIQPETDAEEPARRPKRRRRPRRKADDRTETATEAADATEAGAADSSNGSNGGTTADGDEEKPKKRRRGRRGGRRRRPAEGAAEATAAGDDDGEAEAPAADAGGDASAEQPHEGDTVTPEIQVPAEDDAASRVAEPLAVARGAAATTVAIEDVETNEPDAAPASEVEPVAVDAPKETATDTSEEEPAPTDVSQPEPVTSVPEATVEPTPAAAASTDETDAPAIVTAASDIDAQTIVEAPVEEDPNRPKRRGWWQRKSLF